MIMTFHHRQKARSLRTAYMTLIRTQDISDSELAMIPLSLLLNAFACGGWNMANMNIPEQRHSCCCVTAEGVTMHVIIFSRKNCKNYPMN